VATPHAPRPGGSYSQGLVANGMLYIAGQVPVDPESGTVPTGLGDQVHRVLDNLAAVALVRRPYPAYEVPASEIIADETAEVTETSGTVPEHGGSASRRLIQLIPRGHDGPCNIADFKE
jgi:Endoribonuclease L-PSP